MGLLRKRAEWLGAALAGALLSALTAAGAQEPALSSHDQVVHVLNRITYGPRPGDVDMVSKMGVRAYIERQMHPEAIDDAAVDAAVAKFETLQMSSRELADMYMQERKKALKKAAQLAAKRETPAAASVVAAPATDGIMPDVTTSNLPKASTPKVRLDAMMQKANEYRSVMAIGQLEQAKLVRAVDSQRQLQEVLVDFWGNHFNIDMKKGQGRLLKVADDRDVIRPHIWGKFRDLLGASAKSPAMLFYLDNAGNTVARTMGPVEEGMRAAYMQKMGLVAPAEAATPPSQPKKPKKAGGINENYAREIMELHTLGVDTGYTQKDVQEVARCFTGWTFARETGEFVFRARQHDNGAKVVLGHAIPAGGGQQDGETVLDILAAHPATAHHIAFELCQRFVSDQPPAALVDRIAGVFTQTAGDLRAVTEAILTSPEFLSPEDYNNKIKSPLEFAVSAVRASGSTFIAQQPAPFDKLVPAMEGAGVLGRGKAADRIAQRPRQSLNWHIVELGQPLFACTPPTGYTENSKAWVSPGALIERLNFAVALTEQNIADVKFDPATILAGTDLDKPEAVLDQSVAVLLQNGITDATKKVLQQTALPATGESKTVNPAKLIALIIGSPEFQRK